MENQTQAVKRFSVSLLRQLGVAEVLDSSGKHSIEAIESGDSCAGFVSDITQHAEGICRYLNGNKQTDVDLDLRQGSLWLFLITESIYYALSRSDDPSVINTSKLITLDYDYLEENFMSMITPKVGSTFNPELISKHHEMSSLAIKNQSRLSGLSILSGLGLTHLDAVQRRLFVGDNTDNELAELISSDVEKMTHDALVSWQVDTNNIRAVSEVSDSYKRIYSALLQSEFTKMKSDFLFFNDEEKKQYKKSLNDTPEGYLIKRTREVISRLTREAVPGVAVEQGDKDSELY